MLAGLTVRAQVPDEHKGKLSAIKWMAAYQALALASHANEVSCLPLLRLCADALCHLCRSGSSLLVGLTLECVSRLPRAKPLA